MKSYLGSGWLLAISVIANLAMIFFIVGNQPKNPFFKIIDLHSTTSMPLAPSIPTIPSVPSTSLPSISSTPSTNKLRVYEMVNHAMNLANPQLLVQDLRSSKPVSISPINNNYMNIKFLENSMECSTEHKEQFSILILVKTRPSEVDLRRSCRERLQNSTILSSLDAYIQYGFLIGQSKENISAEITEHNDFVIGDFQDTYQNLTHKSMMGYRWAIERCSDFNFFVSLDVDTYLSLPNLVRFVKDPYKYPNVSDDMEFEQAFSSHEDLYTGFALPYTPPIRNNASKWYVSEKDYPAPRYPPYVTGMMVLTSKETVLNFYYLSPYVQHICIEDAYFGILANKLGIVPHKISNFLYEGKVDAESIKKLYNNSERFDNLLALHRFESAKQFLMKLDDLEQTSPPD